MSSIQGRPQKHQAEVEKCGPYSSIVLAMLQIKAIRRSLARAPSPSPPMACAAVSRGISRGTLRQYSLETGKRLAQKTLLRRDHRNIDRRKHHRQRQRRPASSPAPRQSPPQSASSPGKAGCAHARKVRSWSVPDSFSHSPRRTPRSQSPGNHQHQAPCHGCRPRCRRQRSKT